MGYKVAIAGATGNVGQEVLKILAERKFPVSELIALASARSVGKEVSYGDNNVKVQNLATFDFKGTDIVFSAAGSEVSKEFAPKAAKHAVVIDKTSLFRMDPDIPLVVPEVNPEALKDFSKRNIIAVPNCSTIQMVVALKPLHDAAKIKRVVVATYQSVSGTGKAAMNSSTRPRAFT
jgi:aspartate-semialdehyde dehydrogenase